MSSLAAARADNFYYPPEWVPNQEGNDGGSRVDPLGERAKNKHLGIITIRFELPYNCWCLNCKNFVSKGVRYNAEKKQCGKYLSTKLWEFTMLCHRCKGVIKIQTDPQNRDYKFICGLQPKVEKFDHKDAGTTLLLDDEEKTRAAKDAMYRVELGIDDRDATKEKKRKRSLGDLTSFTERSKDDYLWSQKLRSKFRGEKKELKRSSEESAAKGFGFRLLELSAADQAAARSVTFAPKLSALKSSQLKRAAITSSSIFKGSTAQNAALAVVEKAVRRGLNVKLPAPSSTLTGLIPPD
jgi:coiled-coil domain-containing protein 130